MCIRCIVAGIAAITVTTVLALDPRVLMKASSAPPFDIRSLEDFRLPPKSVFDPAMPRYPNAWFYIDTSLAASYRDAVTLVTDGVKRTMQLREYFGPFDNPEGCDFESRLEHLQPWLEPTARSLQHAHAFHMRYYYSALAARELDTVALTTASGDSRRFYRFAASVHYEVEHFNPNHADVESCPICGRTGAYAKLAGNLVEVVHDPLGLELLFKGTIRGEIVRFDHAGERAVGSILQLAGLDVQSFVFPGMTGDRNTLQIGVATIRPPQK